jgi:methyltransferase (TIGR00027 family)
MKEGAPSKTAFGVAMRRAAHQLLDHPRVLDDPIAVPIVGNDGAAKIQSDSRFLSPVGRRFRAFMAARSRYAEDRLALAIDRAARQYVVLGAGLDTFAYRNPFPDLRVFEVDHPATQAWKLDRLHKAGVAIPSNVVYAPVDFENQTLGAALNQARFDSASKAFFSWLGVTPYLTREAAMSTFRYIASLPPGTGVAFDYAVAGTSLNLIQRLALDALSRRVAKAGEAFQLFFEPAELAHSLKEVGFRGIEDLGSREINARYFSNRSDGLRVAGDVGRVMCAWV